MTLGTLARLGTVHDGTVVFLQWSGCYKAVGGVNTVNFFIFISINTVGASSEWLGVAALAMTLARTRDKEVWSSEFVHGKNASFPGKTRKCCSCEAFSMLRDR